MKITAFLICLTLSNLASASITHYSTATDCSLETDSYSRVNCAVEGNKSFLKTIPKRIPRASLRERRESCFYDTYIGGGLCDDSSKEMCVIIPVGKNLVATYNTIYKNIRLEGFRLLFTEAVITCRQ
jgi:hypothetical protein